MCVIDGLQLLCVVFHQYFLWVVMRRGDRCGCCVLFRLWLETADVIARSADLYLALIGSYISADRQILCVCLQRVTDVDLSSYRSHWSSDSIILDQSDSTERLQHKILHIMLDKPASCVRTSALPPRPNSKLCYQLFIYIYTQVHLNKLECREKVYFFLVNLFQKVKLSYI